MATPYQDLYTAAKAIMALVNTAATHAVTQAPTNYGLDFRVTPGASLYQVQIFPKKDYSRATVKYPSAEVSIAIHHYANSLANEEAFTFATMSYFSDEFLDVTKWEAQSGIFSLDPDSEPEVSQGALEGNVITYEATAVVLMTAV